jgi:hypothetical protein
MSAFEREARDGESGYGEVYGPDAGSLVRAGRWVRRGSTIVLADPWQDPLRGPSSVQEMAAAQETGATNRSKVASPQSMLNQVMGLALDVDGVMGPRTRSAIVAFQQRAGLIGDGVLGPLTEAALIAAQSRQPGQSRGGPPRAGVPVVPPALPAAPGDIPAAWSSGPVDAPAWRPPKATHGSIMCGSREIPVGLRPESVTHGWTPRTQAIVDIIRGPRFGWKNVEGAADGGRSGHVSDSYHYCGRAIDSFAPNVRWDTRATGRGLSESWRLANWAAHNAAALNISQVIFYDRIWTADKGGWRPYANPGGSSNSLQHRDHVHISVY